MKLHLLNSAFACGYATFGCLWPKGMCADSTPFICQTRDGRYVPIQTRVTAWWPDGSIKWTAHTGSCALLGQEIEVLPAKQAVPMPADCITISQTDRELILSNGIFTMRIPQDGQVLFTEVTQQGVQRLCSARPELILEEPGELNGHAIRIEKRYTGRVDSVVLEETGALQTTVKYTGTHVDGTGEEKLPFIIRLRINAADPRIQLTHTFVYDGDEERDFLKGLGIAMDAPISGEMYNRHVKFTGDHGVFHEALVNLTSWRPRIEHSIYQRQMAGEAIHETGDAAQRIEQMMKDVPFWSQYDLCQDSAEHFVIRKKLLPENVCSIDALHGHRSIGGAAFGGENGSVLCAMSDFWEKYPSGYTISGLDTDLVTCQLWFWHPQAPVMDFRHYADRGYNQVCYEGYDYKGATPVGIGCTNTCTLTLCSDMIPADDALLAFAEETRDQPHYVAAPEDYHAMHAFGDWSLPSRATEMENWLEDQLDASFAFYQQEVEQRGWYGMFNYGDVMHTYDSVRHQWKYDTGGYAWDNTELVPTLWLWMYFLRTGRADVFHMAEKMSRHASEVDVYHLGKYKGLGSRHNVRHWGCPCKEARIAMAHHHRYYYYLTGDLRLTDIFEELKDNELSFLNKDPLGDFYDKAKMVYPSHARSGPDWSSLCSNWLMQWERTGDTAYRDKMLVGMADLAAAPLRLISGPDFEFDPHTVHLRYIGERATGGTHLQICMGAPTVWLEMAELLEDDAWRDMLAEYGRFYFLPEADRKRESGGLTGQREFSLPFMAAAMGAYAAARLNDPVTARRTWAILLQSLLGTDETGFTLHQLPQEGNQALLKEIPWISTNFAAQFGVNTIMALQFIRHQLPATMAEARCMMEHDDPRNA